MEKTLYFVPGTSTKLFVDLAAVTCLAWTDDGVDISLIGGGRINVSEDAAINIAETIFSVQAAEYAAKVGDNSSLVKVRNDLNRGGPANGAGPASEH